MQPPYMPPVEQPKKKNNTLILVLVLGSIGLCLLLIIPIGAAILFPVFAQAKLAAQKTSTLSNGKQLGVATLMYSADFDDRLPQAARWSDAVEPYLSGEMPFAAAVDTDSPGGYDFAFAKGLSSKKTPSIEDLAGTAMIFESSKDAKNQAGGKELLPNPGRCTLSGGKGSVIVKADSSAKVVADEELASGAVKFP